MSQTPQIYWKRIGYVAIEDRNGNMIKYGGSNDALDFRFEGEKIGDICPRFKVGILGLSKEHINQLTVWNPADAVKRGRKIQVFAGYEKDGISNPLFSGIVFNAIPSNPPEMWLNFDCIISLDKAVPSEHQIAFNDTLENIAKKIASMLGLDFLWTAKKVDKNKKAIFVFKGSKIDIARRFAETFGVKVFNNNGVMIVCDIRGWLDDPRNAIEISTDTGMLGIGNVNLAGATIRRRLNDQTPLFSWINLKSKIIPSANGDYFVIRVKHVGHFRGDDWYTEIDTIRKGHNV